MPSNANINIYDALVAVDWTSEGYAGLTVHFGIADQNTSFPKVIINRITAIPIRSKGAKSANDEAIFQIDIYHSKMLDAQSIGLVVRSTLDTLTTAGISHMVMESEDSDRDEDLKVYRIIQQYRTFTRDEQS